MSCCTRCNIGHGVVCSCCVREIERECDRLKEKNKQLRSSWEREIKEFRVYRQATFLDQAKTKAEFSKFRRDIQELLLAVEESLGEVKEGWMLDDQIEKLESAYNKVKQEEWCLCKIMKL